MSKLRVGIVGVGKISGTYLKNLTGPFSDRVELTALADLISERSNEAAINRRIMPSQFGRERSEMISHSEFKRDSAEVHYSLFDSAAAAQRRYFRILRV